VWLFVDGACVARHAPSLPLARGMAKWPLIDRLLLDEYIKLAV
jgi:hypothetical protein